MLNKKGGGRKMEIDLCIRSESQKWSRKNISEFTSINCPVTAYPFNRYYEHTSTFNTIRKHTSIANLFIRTLLASDVKFTTIYWFKKYF